MKFSGCRASTMVLKVSILNFLYITNLFRNLKSRIGLQSPFFWGTMKKQNRCLDTFATIGQVSRDLQVAKFF